MSVPLHWIAQEHLKDSAVSGFRRAFAGSKVGLLVIDDFLSREVAVALQTFLTSKAEFEERFGTYEHGDVAESEWMARPDAERMFHFQSVRAARASCELDPETLLFLRFRQSVLAGSLNQWFSEVTGLEFSRTTNPHAHRYEKGNFLREHTDNALGRKLAVIVYLVGDFTTTSGGALAVRQDGCLVERVVPQFNRATFFDVTRNEHLIEPFSQGAESVQRLSIGWWLA